MKDRYFEVGPSPSTLQVRISYNQGTAEIQMLYKDPNSHACFEVGFERRSDYESTIDFYSNEKELTESESFWGVKDV